MCTCCHLHRFHCPCSGSFTSKTLSRFSAYAHISSLQTTPVRTPLSFMVFSLMTPPPTPSSSSSASTNQASSPSTPRLRTIPLPLVDDVSPEEQTPPPPPTVATVRVNSFLGVSPAKFILYDFSFPKGVTLAPGNPLYAIAVVEPATDPPLPSLTVVCPQLDRSFLIFPHSSAYVTVLDVLQDLHGWLQLRIRRDDYTELSLSTQSMVRAAYESRCSKVPDPATQATERQNGIKCVDLLLGLHIFAGLSSTVHGPDIWELHLCNSDTA
jgi:hypothetical protein